MKLIVSIAFLLCTHISIAQDHVIPLWNGEVPNSKVSDLQETKTYTCALPLEMLLTQV